MVISPGEKQGLYKVSNVKLEELRRAKADGVVTGREKPGQTETK